MLQIRQISKQYKTGELVQRALDHVSLSFRESEFVAILGPSGSGKTTLLNIIGGLDRYDSGDLIINGITTKEYKDRDWDSYRNHTVGFVFQSYNLIPHQSVLANVELALTLSGVSKAERRKRAKQALAQVGLADQAHKRPNQMSGGQMQRVAIARALVNNPDILLADEPTGALDSETSTQVMELLKEVARDRLVIMVTHNAELAETYATRIVRLHDGRITDDTMPYTPENGSAAPVHKRMGKTSMSFWTALSLSLNNLRTKKGRTLLTAFAGSIGIIGIALILALSNGIQSYVDDIQRDTLAAYPISVQEEQSNMLSVLGNLRVDASEETDGETSEMIYSNDTMYQLFNAMFTETEKNNLKDFRAFLMQEMDAETSQTGLYRYVSSIQYQYNLKLNTYIQTADGSYRSTEATNVFTSGDGQDSIMSAYADSSYMQQMSIWQQLLSGTDGAPVSQMLKEQYTLVAGQWPTQADELVLILDSQGRISDSVCYALGLMSDEEVSAIYSAIFSGEELTAPQKSISYQEALEKTFRLVLNADFYARSADGRWQDIREDESAMQTVIANGMTLRIVGIIQPSKDTVAASLNVGFGYTEQLAELLIAQTEQSEIVQTQRLPENADTDILTGLPFAAAQTKSDAEKAAQARTYFALLSDIQKAELYTQLLSQPDAETVQASVAQYMAQLTQRTQLEQAIAELYGMELETVQSYLAQSTEEELRQILSELLQTVAAERYAEQARAAVAQIRQSAGDPNNLFDTRGDAAVAAAFDAAVAELPEAELAALYDAYLPSDAETATLEGNLERFGVIDPESPTSINLYANSFEDKEQIADVIAQYNAQATEEDRITYSDYIAMLMSGITTMIDAVSYGLIAFVAISLVVSSIMIGIITYISVLERRKEIGVLRAIGASKRDVSSVFNAETLIVGFAAGAMGILATLLLCIPLNAILRKLTGAAIIRAALPAGAALILVLISMVLTLIAGLIPARVASKKDPVLALRSE